MKSLNWIAYIIALISAGIGIILVLSGLIQIGSARLLRELQIINYFHVANSFFLLSIVLFLFILSGQPKKKSA
jgi:hypothetical protein